MFEARKQTGTVKKSWPGPENTWQTWIFRFRNDFSFLAMNPWEDSIKSGGLLSVWSALENTRGRPSHQCFSLIYSWFKHMFCLDLQDNLGQAREKPVHVFLTPSRVSLFFSLASSWNPDLADASIALYKQAQTHHKYFTLILNAVSISLN